MSILTRSHAGSLKPFPKLCCPVHHLTRVLKLSMKQRQVLENIFATNPNPHISLKNQVSKQLNLERIKVYHWFANKRFCSKSCSGKRALSQITWILSQCILKQIPRIQYLTQEVCAFNSVFHELLDLTSSVTACAISLVRGLTGF